VNTEKYPSRDDDDGRFAEVERSNARRRHHERRVTAMAKKAISNTCDFDRDDAMERG